MLDYGLEPDQQEYKAPGFLRPFLAPHANHRSAGTA